MSNDQLFKSQLVKPIYPTFSAKREYEVVNKSKIEKGYLQHSKKLFPCNFLLHAFLFTLLFFPMSKILQDWAEAHIVNDQNESFITKAQLLADKLENQYLHRLRKEPMEILGQEQQDRSNRTWQG